MFDCVGNVTFVVLSVIITHLTLSKYCTALSADTASSFSSLVNGHEEICMINNKPALLLHAGLTQVSAVCNTHKQSKKNHTCAKV